MKFNSAYNIQSKTPPEQNSGELKVERSGYISAETRITNLMLAGQRLVQSRKEAYDFPDGKIDTDFYDPTRKKGYDLAEAFQDNLSVQDRLKASQTAQEQRTEAEKAKKGVDDSKTEKVVEDSKTETA